MERGLVSNEMDIKVFTWYFGCFLEFGRGCVESIRYVDYDYGGDLDNYKFLNFYIFILVKVL